MAVKTLSIPKYLDEFLGDNPDLSPSKMLQSKIIEIRENRRINQAEIHKIHRVKNHIQQLLQEANEEIEILKEKNVKLVQQVNQYQGISGA